MNRASVLVLLAMLSVLELGSQSSQPTISITDIPAWGQDGQIDGTIYATSSQPIALYVFAFIPDMGWYGLPGTCSPAAVQGGPFSINASPNVLFRSATRFTAYLLPATLVVNCDNAGSAAVPFIVQHNAVSTVTYSRLPQYSTISFGGLDWYVKDAPVPVFPGPQFFIQDNAYLDSAGQLHLRISPCGGSWCAAEVYTKQSVGYGTYQFTINSQLSYLDPNVTLGLFSWDAQAGDQNNREWDIEFSRWGNATATSNAQYVVQPYNGPNNILHFLMNPSAPSTHVVSWSPGQVGFASSTAANNIISQWSFNGASSPVPSPGDVHLHLNFYIGAGATPSVPVTQEVVISAFQYLPSSTQIGLTRTVDSIPYQEQSYTVPLVATGPGCTATVDSDSPWLSVTGSGVIPTGVPVQYTVSENLGSPRSGNLILQSTTCNPALGAQVLTVTQAGLLALPSPGSFESGGGASQVMLFTFSDPRGWQDLDVVNILINNFLDGRKACYLAYSRSAGVLYLVNDAGIGLSPGLVLGGSGSISNSQCSVAGASSVALADNTALVLLLNLTFSASFGGNKVAYLAARDVAANNSGWQPMGVWQVPGTTQSTTTSVVGMSPISGGGVGPVQYLGGLGPVHYQFTFSDRQGIPDLGVQDILMNGALDGRQACYLAYARPYNMLYLMNDAGTGLLQGQSLGASGTLYNSQCMVSWEATPITTSGNNLTLSLTLSFNATFDGNRVFYLASRDLTDANNSGWQAMGTWPVQ